MGFEIRALSEPLGVEVLGLDVGSAISAGDATALRQAFLDHHLVVVRGDEPDPADHLRLCRLFGEIQPQRVGADRESKDFVGMMFVSNVHEDGILPNGEMWFHSDQCYFEKPNMMTSLCAVTIPKSGGNTRFANCHLAYEALPERTRARLDDLRGMNVYDYNGLNSVKKTSARDPDAPGYAHPLVRTHPETGRKLLFVNRLMTDYVVGMEDDASRALLDELFGYVEDPAVVYEHPWRPGDIALFDNRCLLHARTDFDPSEPRLLRRFCVMGDKPF